MNICCVPSTPSQNCGAVTGLQFPPFTEVAGLNKDPCEYVFPGKVGRFGGALVYVTNFDAGIGAVIASLGANGGAPFTFAAAAVRPVSAASFCVAMFGTTVSPTTIWMRNFREGCVVTRRVTKFAGSAGSSTQRPIAENCA